MYQTERERHGVGGRGDGILGAGGEGECGSCGSGREALVRTRVSAVAGDRTARVGRTLKSEAAVWAVFGGGIRFVRTVHSAR